MLYLVGLGLGDAKDITVKGLEAVRRCRKVYLEAYTSVLTVGKEALVGRCRRPVCVPYCLHGVGNGKSNGASSETARAQHLLAVLIGGIERRR